MLNDKESAKKVTLSFSNGLCHFAEMHEQCPFMRALVNLFTIQEVTFSVPSSLRLIMSRSKSFLKPSVLLKVIRPVKPSHRAWGQLRVECYRLATYHGLKPISSAVPQIHPSVRLPSRSRHSDPMPWITEWKVEHFTVLLVLIYCLSPNVLTQPVL